MSQRYKLPPTSFSLAVCGIRVLSEHEDECCVVLQLYPDELPMSCGAAGSPLNNSDTDITSRSALVDAVKSVLRESFLKHANGTDAGIMKGAKVSFNLGACHIKKKFDTVYNSLIGLPLTIFPWWHLRVW